MGLINGIFCIILFVVSGFVFIFWFNLAYFLMSGNEAYHEIYNLRGTSSKYINSRRTNQFIKNNSLNSVAKATFLSNVFSSPWVFSTVTKIHVFQGYTLH